MSFFVQPLARRLASLAVVTVTVAAADCPAIEMFTFFGDGGRIGLPSLEVPIEAYPGIPLRSDRLRARRRAMRMGPGAAVRIGPPGYARGITIRAMPPAGQPATMPAERVVPSPEPTAAPEPPALDDLGPARDSIEEVPAPPAE
ncbi:MAG: hypothetical protein O3C39_06230 [Planctomycetota bacterium]|jgi:hypothetical protein|nr:hypothetical protein [Planctomycetota bacterium]MDA1201265.1 hypothetical protein [Planctomycetota bacterium]